MQRQTRGLIWLQPPQHLGQQPTDTGTDQHPATEAFKQAQHELTPTVQIAQHQFQQQQRQHSADRLQHQALGFEHIPQWRRQTDLTHQGGHHRWAGGQNDGAEHGSNRPTQPGQPVRRGQSSSKGNQQPQDGDALHRGPDRVAGETQVEATVEQHQADQQAHHRAQTRPQIQGFHQAKPRPADQKTGQQQQHHPWQSGDGGQKPSPGA